LEDLVSRAIARKARARCREGWNDSLRKVRRSGLLTKADPLQPVSYTHLDVYKRQPYGMELLASVHWAATNRDLEETITENRAVELVHSWNEHKKIFRPNHIKAAWTRLREEAWI